MLLAVSWAETAREQAGVICRDQLRAAGMADHVTDHLVHRGALELVSRGVYLARGAPLTYRARIWAAVLATSGIVGFGTAAELWGVDDGRPARIELVLPPHRHVLVPPGVRVHRVLVPGSAINRREGLPITSRTWTLLDHLGRLPRAEAFRLADRALQRAWLATSSADSATIRDGRATPRSG
jgi:predicted transcriptional regulator of viral defense system